MLRLRYAGIALVATLGCSPVKDHDNVPDAPIDSTDMRPPMIASSVPMNMATKVSILQPISVFFDENLDPASVSATSVKLGYLAPFSNFYFQTFDLYRTTGGVPQSGVQPLKGTVSYDAAAKKISIVPSVPLPYGAVVTVAMDVKDKAGLAFTGSISFTTFVNAPTKLYSFNSGNGLPNGSTGTPTDMNGRLAKMVRTNAAGTDTIWFTADDPRYQHYDFSVGADGQPVFEKQFAAGADGQYDTPDDVVNACISYRYDATKLMTERTYASNAGPDAMFCTPDDVPNFNTTYQYMGSVPSGFVVFNTPGSDGTWRTSDDHCSYYWDYEYDTATTFKKRDVFHTCGSDALPRTMDDAGAAYYLYEYNADGVVTKWTQFTAGPDAMLFTADDVPGNYVIFGAVTRYTLDSNGLATETLVSTGAGNDTLWGTPDDTGNRSTTTYNAMKLPDETAQYSIGPDNIWGTPDDVVLNYSKFAYDENGNRIDEKTYQAGPDGVIHTPDDRVVADYDFDVNR